MFKNFPPDARIRNKAQFQRVFSKRQRLFGRYYVFHYRANTVKRPRLGVIVSKRNVRMAVDRNRARRVAKENFRLQQNRLPTADIVVVVKRGASEASKKELQQCVNRLLKQLARQFDLPASD